MNGAWITAFTVLAVVVVIQGVVLVGVMTRFTGVLTQLQGLLGNVRLDELFRGLPDGSHAPPFPAARHVAGPALPTTGTATLLLFVEDDCLPCRDLLTEVTKRQPQLPWVHPVAVLHPGQPTAMPALPNGWTVLSTDDSREWSRSFHVTATPYAYVIDAERRIAASGIPNVTEDLFDLVTALRTQEARTALPLVTVADGDLNGRRGHG